MRSIHTPLFAAIAVLGLGACQPQDTTPAPEAAAPAPTAAAEPAAVVARATLAPLGDSQVSGQVEFTVVDGRLHASGQVSGLQPDSEHGFHIHEKGDCSAADGSSAGGHFNPAQVEHGSVTGEVHHGGDMPNIAADAQGNARIDGPVSANVNVGNGDDFDIIGRGLIVHADPDDYTSQPTGNAGGRLACAVIERAG